MCIGAAGASSPPVLSEFSIATAPEGVTSTTAFQRIRTFLLRAMVEYLWRWNDEEAMRYMPGFFASAAHSHRCPHPESRTHGGRTATFHNCPSQKLGYRRVARARAGRVCLAISILPTLPRLVFLLRRQCEGTAPLSMSGCVVEYRAVFSSFCVLMAQ